MAVALLCPQGGGATAGAVDRFRLAQAAPDRGLPQHRRMGGRHLRRRGRGPDLFRRFGAQSVARPGGHAGGHPARPLRL